MGLSVARRHGTIHLNPTQPAWLSHLHLQRIAQQRDPGSGITVDCGTSGPLWAGFSSASTIARTGADNFWPSSGREPQRLHQHRRHSNCQRLLNSQPQQVSITPRVLEPDRRHPEHGRHENRMNCTINHTVWSSITSPVPRQHNESCAQCQQPLLAAQRRHILCGTVTHTTARNKCGDRPHAARFFRLRVTPVAVVKGGYISIVAAKTRRNIRLDPVINYSTNPIP